MRPAVIAVEASVVSALWVTRWSYISIAFIMRSFVSIKVPITSSFSTNCFGVNESRGPGVNQSVTVPGCSAQQIF